ncbi:hypothetical protein FOL47_004199 [Perkinsus chesapeaki]|uniref:DUF6259 domain-containing protein n=1 Tax=Perkinsus chesapeaki TaxID=330153 RepID=A0A7J6N018_PERCH|nr:hypothetical protein FOL47_004199 [Perkinsus chesapeaki]
MSIGPFSHIYFENLAVQYSDIEMVVIGPEVYQSYSGSYLAAVMDTTNRSITSIPSKGSYSRGCDIIVFSHDSYRFSLEQIKPLVRGRGEVVLLFHLNGCTHDTSTELTDNYQCELLLSLWRHSVCGMEEADAGCTDLLCLCFAPTQAVVDTFAEEIDCGRFFQAGPGAPEGNSQWYQDWFVYHNILKYLPEDHVRGTFLDIGAADPFLLSNTVVFEKCLGWHGVCLEPNPRAALLLDVYRGNCTVVPVCIWSTDSEWSLRQGLELSSLYAPSKGEFPLSWVDEETWRREGFMALRRTQTSSVGGVDLYDANCFTLSSLSAMLGGLRADVVSIDVEGAEVELLAGVEDLFALTGAIVVIIETRPATAFHVDQLLMPNGYVKLAMLGQDSVFVHITVIKYLTSLSLPDTMRSSSGQRNVACYLLRQLEMIGPHVTLVHLVVIASSDALRDRGDGTHSLSPCSTESKDRLNVFMLWPWRKEEFTGTQYSAIDSVLFNYPSANVQVVSDQLSEDLFVGHIEQGYCVSVIPMSLQAAVEMVINTLGGDMDDSLAGDWVELLTRAPEKHVSLLYHLAVYALQLQHGGLYMPLDGMLLNTLEYVLPPALAHRVNTTTMWMELYVAAEDVVNGAALSRDDFENTVWKRSWMDRMEDATVICATDCLRYIPKGSPSAGSWMISIITATVALGDSRVDVNAIATLIAKTHIKEDNYVILPCWLMAEPKFPDLWKNFGNVDSLSARDTDLFSPRWTRERQDWWLVHTSKLFLPLSIGAGDQLNPMPSSVAALAVTHFDLGLRPRGARARVLFVDAKPPNVSLRSPRDHIRRHMVPDQLRLHDFQVWEGGLPGTVGGYRTFRNLRVSAPQLVEVYLRADVAFFCRSEPGPHVPVESSDREVMRCRAGMQSTFGEWRACGKASDVNSAINLLSYRSRFPDHFVTMNITVNPVSSCSAPMDKLNPGGFKDNLTLALVDPAKLVTVVAHSAERCWLLPRMANSLLEWYPGLSFLATCECAFEGDPDCVDTPTQRAEYGIPNLKVYDVPFDFGLSRGKSLLISLVETEFVLVLDDDFVRSYHSCLECMLWRMRSKIHSAQWRPLDIVGFPVLEDERAFGAFRGKLRVADQKLFLEPFVESTHPDGCARVDICPMVFLARTARMKSFQWQLELPVGEHEQFFLSNKYRGIQVAVCFDSSFPHFRVNTSSTHYSARRERMRQLMTGAFARVGVAQSYYLFHKYSYTSSEDFDSLIEASYWVFLVPAQARSDSLVRREFDEFGDIVFVPDGWSSSTLAYTLEFFQTFELLWLVFIRDDVLFDVGRFIEIMRQLEPPRMKMFYDPSDLRSVMGMSRDIHHLLASPAVLSRLKPYASMWEAFEQWTEPFQIERQGIEGVHVSPSLTNATCVHGASILGVLNADQLAAMSELSASGGSNCNVSWSASIVSNGSNHVLTPQAASRTGAAWWACFSSKDNQVLGYNVTLQTQPHHAGGMEVFLRVSEASACDGSVRIDAKDRVSSWTITSSLMGNRVVKSVILPYGYGRQLDCSVESCDHTLSYGSDASYQVLVSSLDGNESGFLATLDGAGFLKTYSSGNHGTEFSVTTELRERLDPATLPFRTPFPTVVGVIEGDWFDVANIYREWAVPVFTVPKKRTWLDEAPGALWVNSHWKGEGTFLKLGGQPKRVLDNVDRLRKLIGGDHEVAFHWYEWDNLGYTDGDNYTICPDPTCGFDTHYPHYLPARPGFAEAVDKLYGMGVHVFPYINGRLFDTQLPEWKSDVEPQHACRDISGEVVSEDYGSGTTFGIPNPAGAYWPTVIETACSEIMQNFPNLGGIYLDELAAAPNLPCYINGRGHNWVHGINKVAIGCSDGASQWKAGVPTLTESNAETMMKSVDAYLTLVAMHASSPVPFFGTVYGGHYKGVGSSFTRKAHGTPQDFTRAICQQLLFGNRLGWFALDGDDGLLTFLEGSPESVAFLRRALDVRSELSLWFDHGRPGRQRGDTNQDWIYEDAHKKLTTTVFCKPLSLPADLIEPPVEDMVYSSIKEDTAASTKAAIIEDLIIF